MIDRLPMKGIKKKLVALGVLFSEFCQTADISMPTLDKIDRGDKSVRPVLAMRAKYLLTSIQTNKNKRWKL